MIKIREKYSSVVTVITVQLVDFFNTTDKSLKFRNFLWFCVRFGLLKNGIKVEHSQFIGSSVPPLMGVMHFALKREQIIYFSNIKQ